MQSSHHCPKSATEQTVYGKTVFRPKNQSSTLVDMSLKKRPEQKVQNQASFKPEQIAGKSLLLHRLGFSDQNFIRLKKMLSSPSGLMVVCGPSGSGKSTMLHSSISYINQYKNQLHAAKPVKKAILSVNPDIIMIGDMRDPETATVGVAAALNGDLVLCAMQENSTMACIRRLLMMRTSRLDLSNILLGILNQRIVDASCRHCQRPYRPTQDLYDELVALYGQSYFKKHIDLDYTTLFTLYHSRGCYACYHSGYMGKTGIHEMMFATKGIKQIIKICTAIGDIRIKAIKDGMLTLRQDGILKVLKGMTDLSQIEKIKN